MLSFSKTVLSAALVGAAIVRAQLDPIADISVGADNLQCPVPAPGSDVEASALAIVQFDEVATVTALGGVATVGPVDISVNVCLCVGANVDANTQINIDANIVAEAAPAITAFISTSPLTAALQNALNLGGVLDVDVQPGQLVGRCPTCLPTERPTCIDGTCGCAPCPDTQFYDAAVNACVCPDGQEFSVTAGACVDIAPAPGASQLVRRNRLSNPAIDRRQTNRDSVMQRLRR